MSRFDRIARLIDRGLATAPTNDDGYAPFGTDNPDLCWRCVQQPVDGKSGLCAACRTVLLDEDYTAAPPYIANDNVDVYAWSGVHISGVATSDVSSVSSDSGDSGHEGRVLANGPRVIERNPVRGGDVQIAGPDTDFVFRVQAVPITGDDWRNGGGWGPVTLVHTPTGREFPCPPHVAVIGYECDDEVDDSGTTTGHSHPHTVTVVLQ